MGDWEELRRDARQIEGKLEEKIQAYSFMAQRMNCDMLYDEESQDEHDLAGEIEDLLAALSECNERMNQILGSGSRTSSSALLQRYREILFDYTTEFKKTSAAIQRKRESAELLRTNRDGTRTNGNNQEMDQLLRERSAIHSSLRSIGSILSQAMDTKDSLRSQRGLLASSTATISGLSNNLPSVSRVIDAIQKKKIRDNMIVGVIIASCICFTIWYVFF